MSTSGRPAPLTYVYCVVERERRPSLTKAPHGLPDCAAPRLVDLEGSLWLVVADAPARRFAEKPLARRIDDLDWVSRCAVAHELVVEHCMKAGAAVPMRLLTLFEDDQRALRAIRARRRGLERTLELVRGCQEWGVRVLFDQARASRLGRAELSRAARAGSGAGYLGAKKRAFELVPELSSVAREQADKLYRELARTVTAAAKRPAPAPGLERRLLLDAAFLVPRKESSRFERAVERAARGLRKDATCEVTLTGPWPPYHFVGGVR